MHTKTRALFNFEINVYMLLYLNIYLSLNLIILQFIKFKVKIFMYFKLYFIFLGFKGRQKGRWRRYAMTI